MTWKRFKFALLCIFLWPISIFVAGQLNGYIAPALWWPATRSGATTMPRTLFDTDAWLSLALVDGFVLGLIPLARIRTLLAAALGVFRYVPAPLKLADNDPRRPALWAWVLPSLFFAIRFATWRNIVGTSVLGNSKNGISRFDFFFGPLTDINLNNQFILWFYDRLFFTAPTLFTLAYALAVLFRHHLPELKHPTPVSLSSDPADTLGS
jgi:hypothetical protein